MKSKKMITRVSKVIHCDVADVIMPFKSEWVQIWVIVNSAGDYVNGRLSLPSTVREHSGPFPGL